MIGLGKLYICGTPIGNLEDVSIRLLKTLRTVDLIACEDTRHTIKLLNRYKIKKPLLSYHEHSKKSREEYILNHLIEGKNIALVSDAGMPCISDPGDKLIQRAIEENIDMEVIPGPSACTAALAISGVEGGPFVFEGFLPRQAGKRKNILNRIENETRTVIIYESPFRLIQTLVDLLESSQNKNRKVVVVRELTKLHQEIIRGSIQEIIDTHNPRGEYCIILEKENRIQPEATMDQIADEVEELINSGINKKEAFKMKAREYQLKKSDIYDYFVEKNQT